MENAFATMDIAWIWMANIAWRPVGKTVGDSVIAPDLISVTVDLGISPRLRGHASQFVNDAIMENVWHLTTVDAIRVTTRMLAENVSLNADTVADLTKYAWDQIYVRLLLT